MKVEFIKENKKDNKYKFSELKPGDIFTISDPKVVKSTIYMKIKPNKNQSSSNLDTINLETGELSIYSDTMKEVISIDQLFVHKHEAVISIKLD
jgi:hypothetical protein